MFYFRKEFFMEDRESFVLIKPDGLKNKKVEDCLFELLKEDNIEIIEKKKIILQYEDILIMWPLYMNCFISKKILFSSLANKEIEVWRVIGVNVSDKLNRIKKYIRKIYGKGCISNCIHTPCNSEEAKWQYAHITGNKNLKINDEKLKMEYYDGLFGKMLNIDQKMLSDILDNVIEERNRELNIKVIEEKNNNKNTSLKIVKLLDQIDISMDYAVSVIMEVFGDYYSLKEIIHIILDVDLYGERRLIITDEEQAYTFWNNLVKKYKLNACIEKITIENNSGK